MQSSFFVGLSIFCLPLLAGCHAVAPTPIDEEIGRSGGETSLIVSPAEDTIIEDDSVVIGDDLGSLELIAQSSSHPILSQLRLPAGFAIDIYAEVDNARSLEVVEQDGQTVVFVGNRRADKVYALIDTDSDKTVDSSYILAEGLDSPNGVAYKDGDLYVAEVSQILRFSNILESLDDPSYEVFFDELPDDAQHGWKYIAFGPDGDLYIPIGAPCNICDAGDPYSSIGRLDMERKSFEIIARGIRNTVGFDWHPMTDELWFTDNGRDRMGDNIPPDELNHLSTDGQHFGYPFCHGGDVADPDFDARPCEDFVAPIVKLGPHVAALGMEFYDKSMLPPEYTNKILIAEHGSWNRTVPIGYRISIVDPERKIYQTLIEGWLQDDGTVLGRPVDVEILSDGSFLVSDDDAGLVYRVSYSN